MKIRIRKSHVAAAVAVAGVGLFVAAVMMPMRLEMRIRALTGLTGEVYVRPDPAARTGGSPLGHKWVEYARDGYPTGDARALFWVRTRTRASREWALVSLPDTKVVCRVKGFGDIFWLPGGTAVGLTESQTLAGAFGLSKLWPVRFPERRVYCHAIDYIRGGITAVDLSTLPASSMPRVGLQDPDPATGCRFYADPAYVPEARGATGRELTFQDDLNGMTTTVSVGGKRICAIGGVDQYYPVPTCLLDADHVVIITVEGALTDADSPYRPVIVDLTTGAVTSVSAKGKLEPAPSPTGVSKEPTPGTRGHLGSLYY